MPSPIGHALAGIAAGLPLAPRSRRPPVDAAATGSDGSPRRRQWLICPRSGVCRTSVVLAMTAIVPDLDLLVGAHSAQTHSIGAVVLAGSIGAGMTRSWRWGVAIAAAYATHPLLDWLGTDGTPPIGVMALWPFTTEYFESEAHWFMGISRRYWLPNFVPHNLKAVLIEVLTVGPFAVVALWRRLWWGQASTTHT